MQRSPTCENCQKNYELRDCKPIGPRIPLLLSCGHTFCEGCLMKSARLYDAIECFICKKKQVLTPKGEKGIGNLLPNIYMLGLLLYNRRTASQCTTEKVKGSAISEFSGIVNYGKPVAVEDDVVDDKITDKMKKVTCDECLVKSASCQCKNCDDSKFCDGCFVQIHRASKTLNKHSPLPLDYLSPEQLTCSRHDNRDLEFYDKDLKEPVCAMCIISDVCRGHKIVPTSELEEESADEMIAAANNAHETLSWLEHSKQMLSASLSDEVMDTTQLFSELHTSYTAFHTILLKRQIDIMKEASHLIANSTGAHSQIQELTMKIQGIKKVIKDYEMVKGDKQFTNLKGKEILEKLKKVGSQPCILQFLENETNGLLNFQVEEKDVTVLSEVGKVTRILKDRFQLKTVSEVDEETKEKLMNQSDHSSIEVVQSNELLTDQLTTRKKIVSLGMPEGNYELVYLTHIKDPLDFMVQRCSDKDRLQVMMTAINKYCRYGGNVADNVFNVDEDQILCAQFTADNNWYRARVISAFSPERPDVVPSYNNCLPVEVFYIDYGNTEWLTLNKLRKIQDQFMEVPAMAVPCSLMDIVPPFKTVTWPERSVKAFNTLTGDRPMLMNIRQRVAGKLYVDLKRPDDDEPTRDDDRPISVRDAMVFLDVAVFFSPCSFPNAEIHRSIRDYPPHELLEVNGFIDVTVTHVENPHCVYVQRLDSNILNEQFHLSKLYHGKNKRAWKIDWPYRNLVCAAKFTGDNTWYRAVVRHVNHDETVVVEYVDYGNSETLPFKDIKKIADMFLKLPKQCVKVSLHNLEKPDGFDEWPEETCERLEDEMLNKPFVCLTEEINNVGVASVVLFDTSTSEDVKMNDRLALKNIAKPIVPVKIKQPETSPAKVLGEQPTTTSLASQISSVNLSESYKSVSSHTSRVGTAHTFPQYPPPKLPDVSTYTAMGVFVDDSATVYLHVMDEHGVILGEIMQQINADSYDRNPADTSGLHVMQACLGKYSQDGFWYRVCIKEILNGHKVKIHFIDFGNCEVVNVSELFTEPRYLEVSAQCIHVKLSGLQPVRAVWDSTAIALLKEKILERTVTVKMEGTQTILVTDDNTNIGEMLISKGFARIKEESGSASPGALLDEKPSNDRVQDSRDESTVEFEPPSNSENIFLANPLSALHFNDSNTPSEYSTQSSSQPTSLNTQDSPARSQVLSSATSSPFQSPSKHVEESEDMQVHHSNYLWFRAQDLPDIGTRFDVTVTQVDQPDIVYIQRCPSSLDDPLLADDADDRTADKAYSELKELEDISGLINCEGFFDEKSLDVKLSVGMACIAQYTDDELYYRARIDEVNEEEGVANVVFVDYGTRETVAIESIKPITGSLIELPAQASKVKISGVKPCSLKETDERLRGTDWSIKAMKQFFAMVANKRLIAQVMDVTQVLPIIHLYDRCLIEDSTTGQTSDVLVGKLMADNGFAFSSNGENNIVAL